MSPARLPLRILVHAAHDASTIRDCLGMADYSYHFVLEAFRPLLEAFGEVLLVRDPAREVAAYVAQARAAGQGCVYLSFAPPHQTFTDADCPVVPVFAWEFASLPDESFADDWRNDWVDVLRRCGKGITHSAFAASLVRYKLGASFPIESVPAPVWDDFTTLFPARLAANAEQPREVYLDCAVLDSACLQIDPDRVVPAVMEPGRACAFGPLWSGTRLNFELAGTRAGLILVGFHGIESWGVWSRDETAWVLLPEALDGDFRVRIRAAAHGHTFGTELNLRIGNASYRFKPGSELGDHVFDCRLEQPSNLLVFEGMDIRHAEESADPRVLGLALTSLCIERMEQEPARDGAGGGVLPLPLSGCVFVAIFNPKDGRKNWQDIVTAFCFAFREQPAATLVLKMTHHDMALYLEEVWLLFRRLAPFACRVIVLHGFLERDGYRQLVAATDFIVNASAGEGQCLPLMEFMSAGVPAIAPANTAMLDYISADCALVVKSTAEPAHWPHDPRQVLGTLRQRISWQSLFDAFVAAFELRMGQPERYRAMGEAANRAQQAYCSREVLEPRLARLLAGCSADHGASP